MNFFERKHDPLAAPGLFTRRVIRYLIASISIILGSLLIGVLGYHFTEGLTWLDSLLNASMILGGMGPIDPMHTVAGKLFASFYALFSGVIFLVSVGVLIAPVFHRFLHAFYIAPEDVDWAESKEKHKPQRKRWRSE